MIDVIEEQTDQIDGPTPWDSVDPVEEAVALANEESAQAAETFAEDLVERVEPVEEPAAAAAPVDAPLSRGGGWTIPLLCAGIAILACCLIIPAADENRQMTWEREKLKQDIEQLQKQIGVNDEFLKRVGNDPTLAERLAQRQMKMVREGTSVLDVQSGASDGTSPFLLTNIPPPPPMPEYKPVAGKLAALCRSPKARLYMMGGGLMCIAFGLVMGGVRDSEDQIGRGGAEDAEADAEKTGF